MATTDERGRGALVMTLSKVTTVIEIVALVAGLIWAVMRIRARVLSLRSVLGVATPVIMAATLFFLIDVECDLLLFPMCLLATLNVRQLTGVKRLLGPALVLVSLWNSIYLFRLRQDGELVRASKDLDAEQLAGTRQLLGRVRRISKENLSLTEVPASEHWGPVPIGRALRISDEEDMRAWDESLVIRLRRKTCATVLTVSGYCEVVHVVRVLEWRRSGTGLEYRYAEARREKGR